MNAFDCEVIQVSADGASYQYAVFPCPTELAVMSLGADGFPNMKAVSAFATAAQGALAASAMQPGASIPWSTVTGSPTSLSGYGIIDGVSTSGSYANPGWLTSFAYSKLTGAPSLATVATTGAYGDLSGRPSIPAAQVNSDWNASSGLAQILNKPSLSTGTVTSIGISGSDFTFTGSPVTTSGTIAMALATSGASAGTYSGVTVTAKGIVTGGTNRSFNNGQSRSVVTNQTANGTQISSTRDSHVIGIVSIQNTTTIGGPSSGTIVFEICATNSATGSDWVTVDELASTSTATLAIVLNLVQLLAKGIGGLVPAGWYHRYRALTATGTITYSTTATCQEVLL